MAPPSADGPMGSSSFTSKDDLKMEPPKGDNTFTGIPGPKIEDPYQMREYQKGRLALAFRIFGKFGYDEGVAGHITLRVNPTDPRSPDSR